MSRYFDSFHYAGNGSDSLVMWTYHDSAGSISAVAATKANPEPVKKEQKATGTINTDLIVKNTGESSIWALAADQKYKRVIFNDKT